MIFLVAVALLADQPAPPPIARDDPRYVWLPAAPPPPPPVPDRLTPPRLLNGPKLFRKYPKAAGQAGAQGAVRVRLNVTAKGRVDGCAVLDGSGYAALDAATCQRFRDDARFDPARNGAGRPVAMTVAQRVVWRLHDRLDPPPAPAGSR